MRPMQLLLNRILKIRDEEEGFSTEKWKDIFITYGWNPKETKHISDINYRDISDGELIDIFEKIIINRNKLIIDNEMIVSAADDYLYENSHKWSNNNNEAGDNYGSFIAGIKWLLNFNKNK